MRKTFLKKAFCSILFLAAAMGYSQEAGSIGTLLRNEAKASDINSVRIQVDVQGGHSASLTWETTAPLPPSIHGILHPMGIVRCSCVLPIVATSQ